MSSNNLTRVKWQEQSIHVVVKIAWRCTEKNLLLRSAVITPFFWINYPLSTMRRVFEDHWKAGRLYTSHEPLILYGSYLSNYWYLWQELSSDSMLCSNRELLLPKCFIDSQTLNPLALKKDFYRKTWNICTLSLKLCCFIPLYLWIYLHKNRFKDIILTRWKWQAHFPWRKSLYLGTVMLKVSITSKL